MYLDLLDGLNLGPLAQSVEQRTFNPWVVGSIPTGPTLVFPRLQRGVSALNQGEKPRFSNAGRQHLPPFSVLLGRGVKTLAHLKAGNQSVTS